MQYCYFSRKAGSLQLFIDLTALNYLIVTQVGMKRKKLVLAVNLFCSG